ncbi:MAG: phosphatase PAP2 family protein [Oscillospiraceae bacterium]|nr:phosphatase PAP2 family protein [Oscillospiraceae bacterium]
MQVLYFLQSIRNPVMDAIFSVITMLGEETAFIVVALIVYWCISRKMGYYILTTGFVGTIFNQFLKLTCRVPRPWVKDPNFPIVESARAEATGFSFPSGHSQISVTTFGSMARMTKNNLARWIFIAVCVLVPFSRMYLGVHTPADVLVGAGSSLLMVLLLYPAFEKIDENPKPFYIITAVMTVLSIAFVAYVELYDFPADMDSANLLHGKESAYTMLGCILGLDVTLLFTAKKPPFSVSAPLLGQILKVLLGLALLLAIKEGLKSPLNALLGEYLGRTVRYAVVVIFGAFLWPMTFPLFQKIGKKKG